jgi:hypothetical protein
MAAVKKSLIGAAQSQPALARCGMSQASSIVRNSE